MLEVFCVGACSSATRAWRYRNTLNLTVIVKGTFRFTDQGPMALVEPTPLYEADVHDGGRPTASLQAANELVPRRDQADVVVVGHAHAPAGQTVTSSRVRLALSVSGLSGSAYASSASDSGNIRDTPLVRPS